MSNIAQVSGLIAAAVIVVQYTLPAALVVILVRYVGTENNAVTWSVVNRTIATTLWPQLFRADAVSVRNVPTATNILSWASTIGAALIVLSSVLAPLGLYEDVVPGDPALVEFAYVKDPSPWGRVTMPRPNLKFSRLCESGRRINCPGQYQGVDFIETSPGVFQSVETDETSTVNLTIPRNYTAMFTSATSGRGNTVSGLFDIQYRLWTLNRWAVWDKGQTFVQGDFRYIENLIPQERVILKEGLIIDMRNNPGIGFRNHTVPVGLEYGGTWAEDITWIQPVTSCADTNLSIKMRTENPVESSQDNTTFFIVDRGAFSELDQTALESRPWLDNQTLDLFGRAHKAARMHNVLVASSLNVSLPLDPPTTTVPDIVVRETDSAAPGMFFDQDFDLILKDAMSGVGGPPPEIPRYSMGNISLSMANASASEPPVFVPSYPDGVRRLVALNYSAITQICRGHYELGSTDNDWRRNSIDNPAVQCGFILGTPRDVPSPVPDPTVGIYQKDLYICASSITASIKSVEFRYNGTEVGMSGLEVSQITDKSYPDKQSTPLWAVEHSYDRIMQFDPLWGLVDRRYEITDGFDTLQAEKLWLPTSPHLVGFSEIGSDALAATSMIRQLGVVYSGPISALSTDFTGKDEFAVLERYGRLSHNAHLASQIPSLILTNSLAAALVGTKTSISTRHVQWPASLAVDDTGRGFPHGSVTVYKRVIRYDIRYAIPGFLVLALTLIAFISAIAVFLSSRSIFRTMQKMYNQTSTGRLATNLLRPDRGDPIQASSKWVREEGALTLSFGHISAPEKNHFCTIVMASSDTKPNSGRSSLPAEGENDVSVTEHPRKDGENST